MAGSDTEHGTAIIPSIQNSSLLVLLRLPALLGRPCAFDDRACGKLWPECERQNRREISEKSIYDCTVLLLRESLTPPSDTSHAWIQTICGVTTLLKLTTDCVSVNKRSATIQIGTMFTQLPRAPRVSALTGKDVKFPQGTLQVHYTNTGE